MADKIEKKIVISVEASDAENELKNVKEALNDTEKNLKKVEKESPKAGKGLKSISDGAKAAATGLKSIMSAVGILALLNTLKELLMGNAKVAAIFETAMNFLQIIVNKVVEVVSTAIDKISSLTNGMEHTKAVVGGLIKIAFTPLQLVFYSLVLAVQQFQLDWEKSVFGKGDEGKIKELTKNIGETKNKIVEVGKGALEAGKQIGNNIVGAVKEIGTATTTLYKEAEKGFKDFNLKKEAQRAIDLQSAKKNAQQAAIIAQQEVTRLEGVSEKYRQQRDDARLSFQERQKASDNLKKTLDEQLEAMKRVANAHIAEAQANYALNKSAENYNAVLQAQAELTQVNADIEGKRSEQLAADMNLIKEQEDLKKQLSLNDWDRTKKQMDIESQRSKSAEERYKIERDNLTSQFEGDKKLLEEQSKNMQISEAERKLAADAIITLTQDYTNKLIDIDNNYYKNKELKGFEYMQSVIDNDKLSFRDRLDVLADFNKQVIDSEKLTEEEKTKILTDNVKKRQEIEMASKMAQLDAASQVINSLQSMDSDYTQTAINNQVRLLNDKKISQEEYDKNVAKIQKAAAQREKIYGVGNAIINTAQSVIKALASTPPPYSYVLAAMSAAMGVSQIAKILSTPVDGVSIGSSSTPTTPTPTTPTTTTPTTSFTFAETSTLKTTESQTIKTYVISKDIKSADALERQVVANGTI